MGATIQAAQPATAGPASKIMPSDALVFFGATGGTAPSNRGDVTGRLKKGGSFGHPAGRILPRSVRSRPEEASDEPADPILPQPPMPGQRTGRAGEHSYV
jgi:hypothetical protein